MSLHLLTEMCHRGCTFQPTVKTYYLLFILFEETGLNYSCHLSYSSSKHQSEAPSTSLRRCLPVLYCSLSKEGQHLGVPVFKTVFCFPLCSKQSSHPEILAVDKLASTSFGDMEALRTTLMFLIALLLSSGAHGVTFMAKHKGAIESFIMTGYGKGWKNCDIISDGSQGAIFQEGDTHFVMEVDKFKNFDISTILSSSQCVLMSYYVKSNESFSALIEFGWNVIQHKRLALALKLGSGLTLDMATNVTKLPFMVAAELWNGLPQFLCPVAGESEPRLRDSICDGSLKDKILRVGFFGLAPIIYGKYCNIGIFANLSDFLLSWQEMMVQTKDFLIW